MYKIFESCEQLSHPLLDSLQFFNVSLEFVGPKRDTVSDVAQKILSRVGSNHIL